MDHTASPCLSDVTESEIGSNVGCGGSEAKGWRVDEREIKEEDGTRRTASRASVTSGEDNFVRMEMLINHSWRGVLMRHRHRRR